MLYAILAYHVEAEVTSWTPEEDAAVMTGLLAVHDRLNANKLLGPAARLGATADARTLRGPGAGMVIDGPFAETKEQLLGLYVVNCDDAEAALDVARDLRRVNPSAVYEIRPIRLYLPGEALPETRKRVRAEACGRHEFADQGGDQLHRAHDRGKHQADQRLAHEFRQIEKPDQQQDHKQQRYQPFEHDVLSCPLGRGGRRESS